MSNEKYGADEWLSNYRPCNDEGNITQAEFDAWRERSADTIINRVEEMLRDEDESLDFLLDSGWKWETHGDTRVLVAPYYYGSMQEYLEDALELEVAAQEYYRFKQNRLEELAKNG